VNRGARSAAVAERYCIRSPDVVAVRVAGRPDLECQAVVTADGRAELGALGRPRLEGQTPAGAARLIAASASLPDDVVHVRVLEYRSQHIYLYGEVFGLDRAVPYQGPETVVDLLRRVGGLTEGAAPRDVRVVRPRLAEGKEPEVFPVDLAAILGEGKTVSNVQLEPFDEVYVGEAREAVLERCLPPWARAAARSLLGLGQPRGEAVSAEEKARSIRKGA
jgi:protein involved in polysaccharide export with SLBB domain